MPTMPTMQEIDRIEQYGHFSSGATFEGVSLKMLCAAARRGVEADAEIAQLRRVIERGRDSTRTELLLSEQLSEQRAGNIKLLERAEKAEAECAAKDTLIADWYGRARKAEAELAALKAAQEGK